VRLAGKQLGNLHALERWEYTQVMLTVTSDAQYEEYVQYALS